MTLQEKISQNFRVGIESNDEWRKRTQKKHILARAIQALGSLADRLRSKRDQWTEDFVVHSEHPIQMPEFMAVCEAWLQEYGYGYSIKGIWEDNRGGVPIYELERGGRYAGLLSIGSLGFLTLFQVTSFTLYLNDGATNGMA